MMLSFWNFSKLRISLLFEPDFICVGAQRCGTSYLDHFLRRHQNLQLPRYVKEIHFFDRFYGRGWDWYRSCWPPASSTYVSTGEITPEYMFDAAARQRLLMLSPSVKIIICLRNPVDRAVSSYSRHIRNTNSRVSFSDYIRDYPDVLDRGFYTRQIEPFLSHFNDVLILVNEKDMTEDVLAVKLSKFLNVDQQGFSLLSQPRRINSSGRRRFSTAYSFFVKLRKAMINSGFHRVAFYAGVMFPRFLFREVERAQIEITLSELNNLRAYYAEDVLHLSHVIGRDLIRVWSE